VPGAPINIAATSTTTKVVWSNLSVRFGEAVIIIIINKGRECTPVSSISNLTFRLSIFYKFHHEYEKIAVAKGDGIGPEIMDAVLCIFNAAKVPLEYQFIDMGKPVFEKGYSNGMTPQAQQTIEELGILLRTVIPGF
jgi:hypothetical protein